MLKVIVEALGVGVLPLIPVPTGSSSIGGGLKIGPYGPAPFFRPAESRDEIRGEIGQWGMIRPGSPERRAMKNGRPVLTNNARSETMAKLPTFRDAWRNGQRCIIPAIGFDEPNWESGKNVWWEMRRTDGAPWGIAGLYSMWTDFSTGEVVPNFTMPIINADGRVLFKRLHKHDPTLPDDAQNKRAVVPLHPEDWETWLLWCHSWAVGVKV